MKAGKEVPSKEGPSKEGQEELLALTSWKECKAKQIEVSRIGQLKAEVAKGGSTGGKSLNILVSKAYEGDGPSSNDLLDPATKECQAALEKAEAANKKRGPGKQDKVR